MYCNTTYVILVPWDNVFQTPERARRHRYLSKVLTSLGQCGCLALWRRYTELTIEGGIHRADWKKCTWCLQEQCWSPNDIDSTTLSEADHNSVFPTVVKCTLINKKKVSSELVHS